MAKGFLVLFTLFICINFGIIIFKKDKQIEKTVDTYRQEAFINNQIEKNLNDKFTQNKIKEDKIKITLERKEEIKNIKKDINILISEADNLVEKYNFDKTVKEEK